MVSKNHLKLVALGAIVALSSACKTFEGRMTVNEKMTFNEKKNNTLEAGSYDAKLKIDSEKLVKLEVSVKGNNNNPIVKFKIPKHEQLPSYDGPFSLTAEQTGQPYDVRGSLRTEQDQSPEYSDRERCTYYDEERVCYVDQNGNKKCRWETVRREGERYVRFYYLETEQFIAFDLAAPGAASAASTFDGRYSAREKIYTYEGRCDRHGGFPW